MAGLTLPIGTELGGYVLQGVLGQGAAGTVYRARDADGLLVAFKLLHPNLAADAASRQRLRREVELLQRVKAPCVARVIDAETLQAEAFVVTELVEGTSLDAFIKLNGPFAIQDLARLAEDLVLAVSLIHQTGVVHRDLKPSNVMLRPDGSVVLIDFGLAQEDNWSRLTGTGLIAGTPGFVAPELLRGADVGPGTDRWACAALLLSAATGRPPFGSGGVETVLARVLEGEADTDGLDRALAGWLTRAVVPVPAQRLALEPLVVGLGALARGEEALPPTLVAPAMYDAGPQPVDHTAPLATAATTPPTAPTAALLWRDQPATEPWASAPPASYPPSGSGLAGAAPSSPAAPPQGSVGPEADPQFLPTPLVSAALWLLASAWALHWPWPAGIGAVTALLLGRAILVGNQAVSARQRRYGQRRSDPARTAVGVPWYLLRALAGIAPGLVIGGALAASGYLMVQHFSNWDRAWAKGLAVATVLLLVWWGPASAATRQGLHLVVRALTTPWWQRALIVVLALTTGLVLAWTALR